MAINLGQILFNTLNQVRYGKHAPGKNQNVWVDPANIKSAIDSANSRFQKAVLGTAFDKTDSARRDREARRLLRTSWQVITDSDFDLYTVPLEETPTYSRISKKVSEGITWEEAGLYAWMMERIAEKGSIDGCRNLDDVIARYERLDALAEHLQKGGLLSEPANSREIGDAISVACGRSGELIFCGKGRHRLALARTLKSRAIPVAVSAVHREAVENGAWRNLLNSQIGS